MIGNHAKYTVVLSEIMKHEATMELLNDALTSYPLYKPTSKNEFIPRIVPTREELNTALLNHYKYREIGFETVGRFIDELKIALCEIMPYYNQILFTQDQDFNIIYNVDYKRTIDTEREEDRVNKIDAEGESESNSESRGTSTATGKTTNENESTENVHVDETEHKHAKNIEADTPQDLLGITAEDIDGVNYASMARWNEEKNDTDTDSNKTVKDSGTVTTTDSGESSASGEAKATTKSTTDETGKTTGKESTLETTKGNFGVVSAQDLVMKYRETIRNTVQDIINDDRIQELFMLVY